MTKEGYAALRSTIVLLCILGYMALVSWKEWILGATLVILFIAVTWYDLYKYYMDKED